MHRFGLFLHGFTVLTLLLGLSEWSGADQTLPRLSAAYPPGLDRDGIFEQANQYYLNNELEKALEGYDYLAALGVKNGFLFYNLGNTHFGLGHIGPAVLWYERALRYVPRFHDLQINYQYARSVLADEEFRAPEYGGTLGMLIRIYRLLNLRECLVVTLILFWILGGLWIIRMLITSPTARSWISIPCWIVGIAFILFCFSSAIKIYQYEFITDAIVMIPAVEVKTGPGKDFSTAFSIHEGTKVLLRQQQDHWVRIVLPGNTSFTGWMPLSEVEAV